MIRYVLAAAMLASGLAPTCALAQVQRSFVSTSGDDANAASSCSATTPCRSFAAALRVTRRGGEIVPLTSGGYGNVTITQGVEIAAPVGVYAAITTTGRGDGIRVSVPTTDTVVIRGLTINGLGVGQFGVNATSFGTLHVENCEITGFTSDGIAVNATANANVFINDTTVRNNGGTGASLQAASFQLNVSVDGSRFEGNAAHGILATDGATVTASRTVASGNAGNGFVARTATGQKAAISCDGCTASGNGSATPTLDSGSGFAVLGPAAFMAIARSTATSQAIGFAVVQGTLESLSGTNLVRNNGANTSGDKPVTTVASP